MSAGFRHLTIREKERADPAWPEAIDRVDQVWLVTPSYHALRNVPEWWWTRGSFAKLRPGKVGRATSVVSYSIAKLEQQLGSRFFCEKPAGAVTEAGPDGVSPRRGTIITDVVSLSLQGEKA